MKATNRATGKVFALEMSANCESPNENQHCEATHCHKAFERDSPLTPDIPFASPKYANRYKCELCVPNRAQHSV